MSTIIGPFGDHDRLDGPEPVRLVIRQRPRRNRYDTLVSGDLLDPEGNVLWSHTSSDSSWLRIDLLSMHGHKAKLDEMYPNGWST